MRTKLLCLAALLSLTLPVFAHRLDEYLQAILVSIEQDHIRLSMRLIPGVAVSSAVIAAIDVNGDGVFSEPEQRRYAQTVLRDLSLHADGRPLQPRLESLRFPDPGDMKQGLGEIHLEFTAALPAGSSHRILVVKDRHQSAISVYLMNCLIPENHNLLVLAQARNPNQSYYRIEFAEAAPAEGPLPSRLRSYFAHIGGNFASVPAMFRLGMRHIAEGTDHLLFLLALLLPAPLLSFRSRWSEPASIRHTLAQIVKVVSAFTLGHSLTLALAAGGAVSLPQRPVEVLIAFSILVSAAHALRPLFPGREPLVAAAFGLIHGMAFAATLQHLGVGTWQRLAGILGFNLGIETGQLLVVCGVAPSLILLSRTPAYSIFRFSGALFAGFASGGWILERLFGANASVDLAVARVAQDGPWIAACLFAISFVAWQRRGTSGPTASSWMS
ncbi:MAG: HupE/UreJ family protein [Acidobacteriaceae bacterium]|nr:HupE/UreJ family protein [Acidobacteriaceae bacterium]